MTALPGDPIVLRTGAKLNLFLRVLGRRPDGYHELESVFHGVDLYDDLVLEPTSSESLDVRMNMAPGLPASVPRPEDNLVFDCVRRLGARGVNVDGVHIEILKRIPLGSGLGGGSANAAGALLGLIDLWDLELDARKVAELAEEVGSDVPYCLTGGTALVRGRGGEVTSLLAPAPLHVVLGLSFDPLSTERVYAAWDEVGSVGESGYEPMVAALAGGNVDGVAGLVHNDLEAAALTLRPGLAESKSVLVDAGALGAGMSGSGPTMFGLAADVGHAREVAERVSGRFDRVVVVRSARRCVERVE